MKYCEACRNTYPDEFEACPADQNDLRPVGMPAPGRVLRGQRKVANASSQPSRRRPPLTFASALPKAPAKHFTRKTHITPKQLFICVVAAVALVVGGNLTYHLYLNWSQSKPSPLIVDRDLTRAVQQKLASSSVLSDEKVTAAAKNRVVTLSGTVSEDWKRTTAANIAAGVSGVAEVKNVIQVRPSPQSPPPVENAGNAAPASAPPELAQHKRPANQDPATRAKELVAEGNYYVSQRKFDAATKAYRAALALDGNNYEAQSGLQEAQRLR